MGYIDAKFDIRNDTQTISDKSFFGRSGLLKRIMDIFISGSALIFLLPIFFGIALAIKCSSKGNVFYINPRVGADGKTFSMYKFRSMHSNSDALLKARLETCPKSRQEWDKYQKLKDDPRITRIGYFLRKSSLDELPQLLNVLFGSMSIVGQRPIVPSQKDLYGAENFDEYIRTRPGITGPWQVGGRNSLSFEERITLETTYIRQWSFWLDIKILFKTVPAVILSKGAL